MAERLWRVDRMPSILERSSLSIDRVRREENLEPLAGWAHRNRGAERIRLLLLIPSGRWAEDAKILLSAFPHATLDIHVTSPGFTEIQEEASPRTTVHDVGLGTPSWVWLALRLALARPAPLVFVAGRHREKQAKALTRLWALSDAIVVDSLDALLAALPQSDSVDESCEAA